MEKLETQYSIDAYDCADKINQLIDLVNSQQEAIERLQDHVDHEARHVSEPADDKPEYNFDKFAQGAREYAEKNDTHRTVTLRIPKGMRIGQAVANASIKVCDTADPYYLSDTDLQKALDEVEHE